MIVYDILRNQFPVEGVAHTLIAYRGSILHGTYVPDVSDTDIIGISMPPVDYILGLKQWEGWEYKDNAWDIVFYTVQKFVRLLLASNPNVIELLWLPDKFIIERNWVYNRLREARHLFVSKALYKSFGGYAANQTRRMTTLTSTKDLGARRKALMDVHGYDVKNAAALVLLLRQAIDLLSTGDFVFRTDGTQLLMDIKQGKLELSVVLDVISVLTSQLDAAYAACTLPAEPQVSEINNLLVGIMHDWLEAVWHS